jgi:flagellar biogenesis protein FliO
VAVLLVLLLAAAAAALWWAKRSGRAVSVPGGRRRLKVLERLPLARGAALVVVEYDGRTLLIGQSGDRLSLIEPPAAGE